MNSPPFLPSGSVIMLLLAGCLSAGCVGMSSTVVIHVGEPRLGDAAVYSGSDGSTLTISITSVAPRADPWMKTQPTTIIRYSYQAPGPQWPAYEFEEAIDQRGRIVQQMAGCGWPTHPQDGRGTCHDERTAAFFGGWGWPGALGTAPFWSQSNLVHDYALPAKSGNQSVAIEVHAQREGSCWIIDYDGPDPLQALPFTLATGQAKICPDQPFPVEFSSSLRWGLFLTTATDVMYTQTHMTRGQVPWVPPEEARFEPSSGLRFLEFQEPLYQTPAPDGLPFPTREAIREAANRNATIASFLKSHPQAVPITSVYSSAGRATGGPILGGDSQAATRIIHLADGSGPCQRIEIERITRNASALPTDHSETTYTLRDASTCPVSSFTPSKIAHRQASYEAAAAWGQELLGLDVATNMVGYSHRMRGAVWTADSSTLDPHGYDLNVVLADPHPASEGGITAAYDYFVLVEGRSGAIQSVTVPASKSPLTGSG